MRSSHRPWQHIFLFHCHWRKQTFLLKGSATKHFAVKPAVDKGKDDDDDDDDDDSKSKGDDKKKRKADDDDDDDDDSKSKGKARDGFRRSRTASVY